jgi:uncharacterized coiled-coil protein SlyX
MYIVFTLRSHCIAKKSAASGGAGPQSVKIEQEEMTGQHKSRLQELEMRDMKQNQTIDLISQGIDRLQVTANAMGEEVTTQAGLLAALETDIEKVQEHVDTVNSKLAETLKEVNNIHVHALSLFVYPATLTLHHI